MNEKKFWDTMAGRYDASVNKTYAQAYADTVTITREYLHKESRVLALGCGTGIITGEIARDVHSVTGIDISEKMIREARRKAEASGITNVEYRVGNLSDQGIRPGEYNAITAFNVLYFIRNPEALLGQIYTLLPEGGLFLSVTDCLGGKKSLKEVFMKLLMKVGFIPYMKDFTPEELTGMVRQAGFSIPETKNLFKEPPNLYIAARKEV